MKDVRQVQLALLLTESGAQFVIVGSTARLLHGARLVPKDLDIALRRADMRRLQGALTHLGAGRGGVRLDRASPQRLSTSWSPVDVFVEDELPAWHVVAVDGTELRVADD